ncbi:MAG TPA: MFS transporter, partial [Bryobacteraceae bacterium]|nr:MFS transporter [Bryobacteraceae bacterium]
MIPAEDSPPLWKNRWTQLALSALATVMLASLQYGWTLFVNPIHDANGWSRAAIQIAFTILISINTWLAPFEGWLVDRYGPRPVVMVGGICAAISWVVDSRAHSLPALYGAAVIGGLALGCVFGTCMGTSLKWFPDRRGLAAGTIAAGYGLGAAMMTVPIARMIHTSGYRQTFFTFGLIQGAVIFLLGIALVKPYVA